MGKTARPELLNKPARIASGNSMAMKCVQTRPKVSIRKKIATPTSGVSVGAAAAGSQWCCGDLAAISPYRAIHEVRRAIENEGIQS
jgi:hypothetical protein